MSSKNENDVNEKLKETIYSYFEDEEEEEVNIDDEEEYEQDDRIKRNRSYLKNTHFNDHY
jgi:protein-arginine kinase